VEDLRKQITIAGVVHDDVRVVGFFEDAVESDDIGVSGCQLMYGDFLDMEMTLSGGVVCLGVHEAFDGVGASMA
jgi:hypothetical protein